jgi:hypothetical protein
VITVLTSFPTCLLVGFSISMDIPDKDTVMKENPEQITSPLTGDDKSSSKDEVLPLDKATDEEDKSTTRSSTSNCILNIRIEEGEQEVKEDEQEDGKEDKDGTKEEQEDNEEEEDGNGDEDGNDDKEEEENVVKGEGKDGN